MRRQYSVRRPRTAWFGVMRLDLSGANQENIMAIEHACIRVVRKPWGSTDLRPWSEIRHTGPIEQVFAKLKHMLRNAGARTIDALYEAIGQLLSAFPPEECTNYFKNAGYILT
jgi:hypothetical protein